VNFIKPSHEILAMSGHLELPYTYMNPKQLIEVAGKTCYKSEETITSDSSNAFVKKAQENRHLTVLEHSWAVAPVDYLKLGSTRPVNWNKYLYTSTHLVKGGLLMAGNRRAWKEAIPAKSMVMGAEWSEGAIRKFATMNNEPALMCATVRLINDRGVSHEEVRHRPPVFSQESTRYVNYLKKMIQFVLPHWVNVNNFTVWSIFNRRRRADLLWWIACWGSEFLYCQLIKHGWSPQQARDVLINSLKTELVMSCSLQEWQHIFIQRALGLTGRPHPQMQEVMVPLLNDFYILEPRFFSEDALMAYYKKAYEVWA